jgi:alkanesulfonate monooxygenase SsuD/methylene tetrahydromethanopterin reductase-like flavin-dependent oxidoreductase (luciferase family)
MDKIGRERGWGPMTREQFDESISLEGANFVGSPAQITEKILHQHEMFKHDRFLIQFTVGSLPPAKVLRSIELFATEVAPAVRKATATG